MSEQRSPIRNHRTPIVDLVVREGYVSPKLAAHLKVRKELGESRYGVALQAFNGRDTLRDAVDEALDLVVYLRQAMEEEIPDGVRIRYAYALAVEAAEKLVLVLESRQS